MLGMQETRLIASILALLLLGWAVKGWRDRHRVEPLPAEIEATQGVDQHP